MSVLQARDLRGRPVVDLDAAETIGKVDELILDCVGCRVAAIAVISGQRLPGLSKSSLVPAGAVHAVGPDAITILNTPPSAVGPRFKDLPRLGQLVGRRLISRGGRLVGAIEDALIDSENLSLVGYAIDGGNPFGALQSAFDLKKVGRAQEYVHADADLRFGTDLIVVPDNSISRLGEASEEPMAS